MKRNGKPVFFIVAIAIIAFSVSAIFGISSVFGDKRTVYIKGGSDIRFGIDIRGGVDVTFTPPEDQANVTQAQMAAAEETIKQRLTSLGITDNEVYTDFGKHRIIVRFPWKSEETNFDPEAAIKELGETAQLTFREGYEVDDYGQPTGVTASNIILEGTNVTSATAGVVEGDYVVKLSLNSSAATKFSEATQRLAGNGTISIWMDDVVISNPSVSSHISNGEAIINKIGSLEEAQSLANKITAGALPFKLVTASYNTITPTLGEDALQAMVIAGIIAYILIAIFMILFYRLPGVVAAIALLGQVGGNLAAISGYLIVFNSFTLTLPGIAGIILGIGFGVDANILTASRVTEELNDGKSLIGAIDIGFKRAFSAVMDGNVTVIIVAVVLMGAFGPPDGFFAKMLKPVFFIFGQSTAGSIYSFGYTLLIGVLLNFLMSVFFTRLMLRSLARFKIFQNPWLYGGAK